MIMVFVHGQGSITAELLTSNLRNCLADGLAFELWGAGSERQKLIVVEAKFGPEC